ncbi:MAG: hypothetical protein HGA44_01940 [Cellulomonadaceae bacterium]|nr:hypothetical protein [Cellulomonadaceae bacterium]
MAQILNGQLPESMLAAVPGTDQLVAAGLLDQLVALRSAFEVRFDKSLGITNAYRTFDAQVRLRKAYLAGTGNFAVVPGTSNHGLGIAVDLGSGVNRRGSTEHEWTVLHGPEYGFHWLTKAGDGSIEPWHFDGRPASATTTLMELEDNMPSLPEIADAVGERVKEILRSPEIQGYLRDVPIGVLTGRVGTAQLGPAPVGQWIVDSRVDILAVRNTTQGLVAQVAALDAALRVLASTTGADPDAVSAAAEDGARRALDDLRRAIDGEG